MSRMRHLGWAFVLAVLPGCPERSACSSTGGEWSDCAGAQPWCDDGIVRTGEDPAVCEPGCACPGETPVWDPEAGCITELNCEITGGS